MVQMAGQYTKGKNKGRQWEVYAEPGTSTGYTRKEWDPNDSSNNGGPTEYFSPFNYSAAQADDQLAQQGRAEQAARAAQVNGRQQDDDRKSAAFWQGVQQGNERTYQRGVYEFDQGQNYKNRDLESRNKLGNRELDLRGRELDSKNKLGNRDLDVRERLGNRENDLRELDTRTRLQLGLRELELRDREGGAKDFRDRERNVMDYLGAIGKLRLPYAELQALSQRAVQGIIPGGAAPTPAPAAPLVGPNGQPMLFPSVQPGAPTTVPTGGAGTPAATLPAGALTPDQWQALAQGMNRDWEQSQIGQGSAVAA
jgi:hypothetical protein